ncbi:DUF2927 domain-containing protein [Chryseotalea sanaruensis]|uniref:DUF2927 domain-containing protein n=1 Tax=Chryseotalea sanaruensis TaxID=2482724 RepID=A0A401UFJ4_9BACT|nr:DUF2927 domain-containing protein [Chryseotalea sanaruensis]GCC53620.1 DUF2927 domain-containing protein [Chryseotalea sanaruensis]
MIKKTHSTMPNKKKKLICVINKRLIYVFVTSLFITSCSKEDQAISPRLNTSNESVINYFKEIALGFEFGDASKITRRWEGNMKIFIGGHPKTELLTETNRIVDEINELSSTEFKIEIVDDTLQSNFYIYFGSGSSYANIFPSLSSLVISNFGLFYIFWDNSNVLFKGYMYIDINRATLIEQKHLLREELTQSLGLAKDSELYPESIFQSSFSTKTTDYAPIDRDLIRLLYHPKMKVGLNQNEVDNLLRDILLAEQ